MAMEGSLQEILERLLAGQQEMEARADSHQEKAEANEKAHQEEAIAELKAAQAEMKADINVNIKASQEKMLSELKADLKAMVTAQMATNQAEMLACPEEMEADVSSEETEATNLEARLETTDAAVERRITLKKRHISTISGHRRTGAKIDAWSWNVAEGQTSGPKTVLGPGRNSLPPASESYVVPYLQCARDRCVKVQARTALQEKHLQDRCLGRDNGTTQNVKTVDWTVI
jgi:hypothetical protein